MVADRCDALPHAETLAFYFAIVLVALVVIAAIFLKKAKPEKLAPFMKSVKYFVFGVATTFVVTMLTLKISDDVQGGSFVKEVFWPIMSIVIVAFALVAAGYVINTVKPEFMRKFKFIALFLILIPVIVSIAFLAVHFKKVGGDYEGVSQAGLYISAIVLVLILVVAATVFSKRNGPFTTREMAYAAITRSAIIAFRCFTKEDESAAPDFKSSFSVTFIFISSQIFDFPVSHSSLEIASTPAFHCLHPKTHLPFQFLYP